MRYSIWILLFSINFSLLIPLKWILAADLLIVQVQIVGEKSSYDSIKIYNPTDSDIYLGNFQDSYLRLVKRTKTSAKDYTIKSWSRDPEAKIPAKGYYLWASNKDGYDLIVGADVSTSQTISDDNGVALRQGPENTGQILDALGWGDFNNLLFEGASFSQNPGQNQKLERKQNNGVYQDINNNSQDFYLNPPSEISQPEEINQKELQRESENQAKIYPSNIFISEILPSPLGPDEKEEWIEVFNNNPQEVDLSSWQIQDKVGKITTYTFPQGTKISPQGFLVLIRPETKIVLNNDGDEVSLLQPNGKLVETINYEKAPSGQSFARKDSSFSWTTTLTPGKANIITQPESEAEKEEPPTQSSSETKISQPQDQQKEGTIIYPSGIFINEILPSPTGPDETEEWIEIFNSTNSGVDLSGWRIQDTKGKTKTYTFPKDTKISSQGFLVLKRPETKITLNNDGDGLNLILPDGKIIDSVNFGKAPQGQSYNRTPLENDSLTGQAETGWVWTENLTPGSQNIIPTQTEEEKEEEEIDKTSEKGLAAIGQKFPKFPRSLLVLLIALAIAIFSGIVILILKKKLKEDRLI